MRHIVDALLQDLHQQLSGTAIPRVRALHLPPTPWNGSKDGEFSALELDDGAMGLSYVLLDNSLAELAAGVGRHSVIGANALDVAQAWRDGQGSARTLGFAAVNALSRHLYNRLGLVPPLAVDSIAGLAPQTGEHIGMVGFFPPLIKQVTASGARLTVLELRSDLLGEHPHFRVTADPVDLGTCTKVMCTSTTLLNHTLGQVLSHCRQARQVALIGPGAGCWPGSLFTQGITALAGSWIMDGPGFAQALRSGQPWGAHARKFCLSAGDWQAAQAGPAP